MTRKRRPNAHEVHGVGTPMRVYRRVWLLVCATLAAVGVTVVVFLSPAALVFLFLAFAVLGVLLMLGADEPPKTPGRSRARRVLSVALVVGTTAPAYLGLAVALGAGVFLLTLIVVASSPYALSAYARWMRGASTLSPAPLAAPGWAPPQLSPELRQLSTEELCQAWCASYLVLVERSAGTLTNAMLATVQERQRYLDELERRNPTGLAAWLASGARVASNPLPYLVGNRADGPAINWEELT